MENCSRLNSSTVSRMRIINFYLVQGLITKVASEQPIDSEVNWSKIKITRSPKIYKKNSVGLLDGQIKYQIG